MLKLNELEKKKITISFMLYRLWPLERYFNFRKIYLTTELDQHFTIELKSSFTLLYLNEW